MYYGNQNPFERDSYDVIMCRDARKAFSRFHFGILAYIGSAYLISLFIGIFLAIILGEAYITLTENYIFLSEFAVIQPFTVIDGDVLTVTAVDIQTCKTYTVISEVVYI